MFNVSNSYPYVKDWLEYNCNENELIDYLLNDKYDNSLEIIENLKKDSRQKKVKIENNLSDSIDFSNIFIESFKENSNQAEWVPALFKKHDDGFKFVYGGVILQPKLIKTENLNSQLSQNKQSLNTSKFQLPIKSLADYAKYNRVQKRIERYFSINFGKQDQNLGLFILDKKQEKKFEDQFKILKSYVSQSKIDYEKNGTITFPSAESYQKSRKEFESKKEKLKKEWERHFNMKWPTELVNGKNRKFEAHHIIPLEFGGANEWCNIVPLTREQHRGKKSTESIHHGEFLNNLEDYMSSVRDHFKPNYKQ
ncbi:unnamed protein product [Brachionus calyciflorus]|uniref:HNH nuclease domain-containing protein n=1 Tax=Brachionus calyciflorus TaxID=104777 RepID=A0A814K778_9BILA|nr:unnamed protein product [Brachionus calyciflorus]